MAAAPFAALGAGLDPRESYVLRADPVSLVAGFSYDSLRSEAIARIGVRIVVFDRRDPRVSTDKLGEK
jgi:hypothetical protein